ncbi:MAG TPA: hypothetical protein VMR45_03115 [Patescibacteria group bacterium]|nr:hypothetical protein [Patescibacteria group bacterium]
MQKIKPGLIGLHLEDQWEEGQWESEDDESISKITFGQDPRKRWFIEYSIDILNKNSPKKRFWHRKDRSLDVNAYLGIVICSPAFKSSPPGPNEKREDLAQASVVRTEHALVQNIFSEEAATHHLEGLLDRIEATDIQDLKAKLAEVIIVA